MTSYRELAYMCLDSLKLISDDSIFRQEHILFLLDKFRGFLLKKTYSDIKKEIPESNYQTVCLDLEQVSAYDNDTCGGNGYLRSIEKLPEMMTLGNTKVSTMDYFQGNINYVNRERFKYVGSNKYLQNQIYSTIAPDEHLYLKSSNPQAYYLNKVKVTGLFEDSAKAAELACPDENGETPCDVMDMAFPLEEALIPSLIEAVVQTLAGSAYKPADKDNDATDGLSKIADYLARNLKKGWDRDNG